MAYAWMNKSERVSAPRESDQGLKGPKCLGTTQGDVLEGFNQGKNRRLNSKQGVPAAAVGWESEKLEAT